MLHSVLNFAIKSPIYFINYYNFKSYESDRWQRMCWARAASTKESHAEVETMMGAAYLETICKVTVLV